MRLWGREHGTDRRPTRSRIAFSPCRYSCTQLRSPTAPTPHARRQRRSNITVTERNPSRAAPRGVWSLCTRSVSVSSALNEIARFRYDRSTELGASVRERSRRIVHVAFSSSLSCPRRVRRAPAVAERGGVSARASGSATHSIEHTLGCARGAGGPDAARPPRRCGTGTRDPGGTGIGFI